MKKIVIIFLILFSFYLGWSLKPVSTSEEDEKVINEKPSFSSFKPVEKNKKWDVQKAKDYYGKAFILFLSAVGVKLTEQESKEFAHLLEDPETYIAQDLKRIPENEEQKVDEGLPQTSEPLSSDGSGDDLAITVEGTKGAIEKPQVFRAEAKIIKSFNGLRRLNGMYEGRIEFIDRKKHGRRAEVILEIDFQPKDNKNKLVEGKFRIELSKQGQAPYSISNGSGNNNDIRVHKDHPGTFLIDASPNSFLHLRGSKTLKGIYYLNNTAVGFAILKKISG